MRLLCGILTASMLLAASPWERVVLSGKGESRDLPAPHPLSYFTENPLLRDDGFEFCRAFTSSEYSIRSEVKPVGELAGYLIVDVLYSVNTRGVTWKSILVQTGADNYREIFHLQAFYTTFTLKRSRIVQSGNESVLVTMDKDGGNGGGCWEGYWWFDGSGPHAVDFSRLRAAITERLPRDTSINMSCANLDLGSQQVQSAGLTARFRLNGPVAEPASVIYHPL